MVLECWLILWWDAVYTNMVIAIQVSLYISWLGKGEGRGRHGNEFSHSYFNVDFVFIMWLRYIFLVQNMLVKGQVRVRTSLRHIMEVINGTYFFYVGRLTSIAISAGMPWSKSSVRISLPCTVRTFRQRLWSFKVSLSGVTSRNTPCFRLKKRPNFR